MTLDEFWTWLQDTELSFQIGATWWFPFLESIHVIGIAVLLGAIMTMDFRLIGAFARSYHLPTMIKETASWAWIGFGVCVLTGTGLFISRPGHYAENPAFQIKLILLVVAGINVLVAHRWVVRIAGGNLGPATLGPLTKATGYASLFVWVGVVIAGRWTGHLN